MVYYETYCGYRSLGSCAAGACEPCQVWKEAALSRKSRVPQGCLGVLVFTVYKNALASRQSIFIYNKNYFKSKLALTFGLFLIALLTFIYMICH